MERDRQYFHYRAKRRSQKTARFYPQGFERAFLGASQLSGNIEAASGNEKSE